MREAWRDLRVVLSASWRISRRSALIALAEPVANVFQMLTPLFAGLLVDAVVRHSLVSLVVAVIGLSFGQGLAFLLIVLGVEARLRLTEQVGHEFDVHVATLSGGAATTDHLEDPATQDTMQALSERLGVLGFAYNSTINGVRTVLMPLTTLVVAAVADLRLLLLVVVALPTVWAARRSMSWEEQAEELAGEPGRLSEHLIGLATSPTPSAELRVLGARHHILRLLGSTASAWRRPYTRAEAKSASAVSLVSVVYLLAAAGLLIWILHDTTQGRVGAGQAATAVLVVGQLRDSIGQIQSSFSFLATSVRAAGRYRRLREYAEHVDAEHAGTEAPPDRLHTGIRLEDVSFTYPGAKHPSLTHVDLDLPAGTVVAVVGENGAGKSTLVGLLTGMHDVDEGRVLIDGGDLRDLDPARWRERCSGAFQDHARFELTAGEAVSVGDITTEPWPPHERWTHAALQRASATDVLDALPQGLHTQLGTSWPDGVDLSGGQWQRLAIARGMMRETPLLLVLDEPTSALDPATEHALFDSYVRAAHAAGDRGAITLLVTHRFSTVAAADLVVVLADGGVSEVGTHAELMRAGGAYAQLYGLQRDGYASST